MNRELAQQRALALWQEGHSYHLDGDLEQAIHLYSASIHVFPTAEAHTFRAWAYSALRRFDDAIAECKRAIKLDPGFGNPYNDIGSYLLQLGRTDEAIEWLEKAKKAPRYEPRHFPYMNLGRLYAAQGLLKRAIAEFQEALVITPGDPVCSAALKELQRTLN